MVAYNRGVLKRRVLLSFLYTENGQRISFMGGGGVGVGLQSHASCQLPHDFLRLVLIAQVGTRLHWAGMKSTPRIRARQAATRLLCF